MSRKKSTHVDDPVAAGRRLREARRGAGLSQRQLAFPGCSAGYISRIEAGERIASLQVLRVLASRLGLSDEYLATGRAPTFTSPLDDAEVALRFDEMEEAAHLFESALKDAPGDRERTRALEGLGHVAFRSGDPQLAVDLFEKALSLVQDVRFAGLLGAALTDNGSYAEAERVLATALSRGREVKDPYTRARLYWSESRLRLEQGQSEIAARYAQRTLEILRTTEDGYAIAHVLQSLAQIHLDLHRPREALELLDEGRELITVAGTPLEIAQYRIDEARALAALGKRESAAALAMEVSSKLKGTEAVDAGRSYALLGGIFAELGEGARARELLELAVELLEQQAPSRYLVQAYKRLAEVLKQQGDTEGAFGVLERALGVQERVGRPLK